MRTEMTDVVRLIAHHGYLIIFLVVLAESLDLPLPAAIALIGGGAAAASHSLRPLSIYAIAMAAMLLGDSIIFMLGRYAGWNLLGLLCRVSVNPETCILRSAELFYKRGKKILLVAKFIPGINTMTPPLAGSMKMRFAQFLWLDFAGASLYVLAYVALGYLFHDFIESITRGLQAASHAMAIVLGVAFLGYLGYRIYLFRKHLVYRVVPRVQVQELARRLKSEHADNVLLVDVRSHGYYDSGAARIKGSIRLEPNNLLEEIKLLPKNKDMYVYCT
jgi:membrane protein DedA with SNARE-associated domain